METEITLPTSVKERGQELVALRQKQADNYKALQDAQTADERSAIKAQCAATLEEIDAKAKVFEEDMNDVRAAQENAAALKSLNTIDRKVAFGNGGGQEAASVDMRSLGQRITESAEFRSGLPGIKSAPFNIEIDGHIVNGTTSLPPEVEAAMKTTMTTAAGWAPFGFRQPGFVESAQRTPTLADLIPQDTIDSPIFYYMEETTFTNNAAYVAEGTTKPESAFALTSRTVEAAKIATTLPVSEEQLEDIPQARAYIDNRLTFQIQLAEESALLNFTNGANKWDGFLQKSGVQTQAAGTDPTPTAVLKAMTKIQYSPGFAGVATGIAMNPTDWQNVLTLQETTGAYIWSMPSAPTQMPDARMWGMTVRPVAAMTQGTSLLGNFRVFSHIWRRSGLSIRMAYANDDALLNLVRIIAEERLALVISRASAFAKITGLAA